MRRIEEFWIEFNPPAVQEEVKTSGALQLVYDMVDSLKGAIIVVFLVFAFIFRAIGVDGESMVPTLNDGDWVAISGVTTSIERGDIVVVTQPWERNVPIIKRVIAVGGDTVYIDFDSSKVYVNGTEIYEPYIKEPTKTSYDVEFPLTVEEGKIFVMGDNRNVSLDSRSSKIGLIDEGYVLGKALVRLHPAAEWKIYD
ncbi:MAG: signal peptidase I [Clostridia bacterium]|nr:signal peptidase I [Clostridia bacterium]